MFILELQASDLHTALGRLLDQARVAGLKLAAVSASEDADGYTIRTSIDIRDRETVEKLARRIAKVFGVSALNVQPE